MPSKTCNFCVMDESDKDIVFYDNGCNHCQSYFRNNSKHLGTFTKLADIIVKSKSKGREFDFILGVSGGADSSYTAFIAHRLNVRTRLVHLDNEYDDQRADENIRRLVDYTSFEIEYPKISLEVYRDIQLAYLKSGVIDLEIPTDHAITATVYDLANKYGVNLLSGNNFVTESIMPESWNYRKNDLINLKDIHRRFGKIPLTGFPTMGLWKNIWYRQVKGIKQINVLNYIDYNREKAKQELTDAFGWQCYGPKHWENIYTRFYQAYILPKRWGIDKRRSHLSNLICSNQITRDEAIKELEKPPYPETLLESDKRLILSKLKITESAFASFMEAPKRNHYEFANDRWQYDFLKLIRGQSP